MDPRLTHLVTLSITPAWQPTDADTGRTGEFWCGESRCRVEYRWPHMAAPDYMHGLWTEAQAQRFAASMSMGDLARAVPCEPYFYAPAYGRIDGQPVRLAGTPEEEHRAALVRAGAVL